MDGVAEPALDATVASRGGIGGRSGSETRALEGASSGPENADKSISRPIFEDFGTLGIATSTGAATTPGCIGAMGFGVGVGVGAGVAGSTRTGETDCESSEVADNGWIFVFSNFGR